MGAALRISELTGTAPLPGVGVAATDWVIDAARVELSEDGLRAVLAHGGKVHLDRLEAGSVWVRLVRSPRLRIELSPAAAPTGELVLTIVSVRAGLLPVPGVVASALLAHFRSQIDQARGIRLLPDRQISVDLAAGLSGHGVNLPGLNAVFAREGRLELVFRRRAALPGGPSVRDSGNA